MQGEWSHDDHDAGSLILAPADVDGTAVVNDLLCRIHYPLQCLFVYSRGGAIPHSDAGSEDTLHHTPAKRCEDQDTKASVLQPPWEVAGVK